MMMGIDKLLLVICLFQQPAREATAFSPEQVPKGHKQPLQYSSSPFPEVTTGVTSAAELGINDQAFFSEPTGTVLDIVPMETIEDPRDNFEALTYFLKQGPKTDSSHHATIDALKNVNYALKLANEHPKPEVALQSQTQENIALQTLWETAENVIVDGGSLRTCTLHPSVDRVLLAAKTDGRPLNADFELWQGPTNTPQKISVYIENGSLRPFSAVVRTPNGSNTVAIRNTGSMAFPFTACMEAECVGNGHDSLAVVSAIAKNDAKRVQGGSSVTYPFPKHVAGVQVILETGGGPLAAHVELLQGPNNIKQVMEVYTDNGLERPFSVMITTPGGGNVIRVRNLNTIEFPLDAHVDSLIAADQYDVDLPAEQAAICWDN